MKDTGIKIHYREIEKIKYQLIEAMNEDNPRHSKDLIRALGRDELAQLVDMNNGIDLGRNGGQEIFYEIFYFTPDNWIRMKILDEHLDFTLLKMINTNPPGDMSDEVKARVLQYT